MLKIKKYKSKVLTMLLFLFLLYFFPLSQVHAYFINNEMQPLGIKIELRKTDLIIEEEKILDANLIFQPKDLTKKIDLSLIKLKNEGTLTSKLAYRIVVRNLNETSLSEEQRHNLLIELEDINRNLQYNLSNNLYNENEYYFLNNEIVEQTLLLEPGESVDLKLFASIKSNFSENESLEIKIDFLLLPEDASEPAEHAFSDTASSSFVIHINSSEINEEPSHSSQELEKDEMSIEKVITEQEDKLKETDLFEQNEEKENLSVEKEETDLNEVKTKENAISSSEGFTSIDGKKEDEKDFLGPEESTNKYPNEEQNKGNSNSPLEDG